MDWKYSLGAVWPLDWGQSGQQLCERMPHPCLCPEGLVYCRLPGDLGRRSVMLAHLQFVSKDVFSRVPHVWGHQHVSPKLPVTLKPHSPNWLPGFLSAPISPVQIIHFLEKVYAHLWTRNKCRRQARSLKTVHKRDYFQSDIQDTE